MSLTSSLWVDIEPQAFAHHTVARIREEVITSLLDRAQGEVAQAMAVGYRREQVQIGEVITCQMQQKYPPYKRIVRMALVINIVGDPSEPQWPRVYA